MRSGLFKFLKRPEGMTAKQWLDENNIYEQTYYHWLKRIRQETYELATNSANTACVKTMHAELMNGPHDDNKEKGYNDVSVDALTLSGLRKKENRRNSGNC